MYAREIHRSRGATAKSKAHTEAAAAEAEAAGAVACVSASERINSIESVKGERIRKYK